MCVAFRVGAPGANAYLDAEILVDFESPFEQEDVLGQVGELPHVAQPLEHGRLLCGRFRLHLIPTALSGDHSVRSVPAATRLKGGRIERWCLDQVADV